jgi:hypothetical protein
VRRRITAESLTKTAFGKTLAKSGTQTSNERSRPVRHFWPPGSGQIRFGKTLAKAHPSTQRLPFSMGVSYHLTANCFGVSVLGAGHFVLRAHVEVTDERNAPAQDAGPMAT